MSEWIARAKLVREIFERVHADWVAGGGNPRGGPGFTELLQAALDASKLPAGMVTVVNSKHGTSITISAA